MLRPIGLATAIVATVGACGSSGGLSAPGDGGATDATSGTEGGSASRSSSGGSSGSSSGAAPVDGGGGIDAGPSAGSSVLQFHNHRNRDGAFTDPKITASKAAGFKLDTTFNATFVGNVYASPLYVQNGPAGKGAFYLPTENNDVYAFDESTGNVVWHKNLGTPAQNSGAGCGNIHPLGITGTPAIDLGTRLIVLDAVTADGSGNIGTHSIEALSIDDGTIKWHVDVSKLSDATQGLAFSPQPQNERGAVLIVGGTAYVVYGGHAGDCGNYHGWVVGVPLSGAGAKAWATKVQGAGIWGPGGASSDGQSIFITTGNGKNDTATWAESEGLFRLDPGPSYTGQTADYFATYDWQSLDQGDVDLSGSGPLILDVPSFSPPSLAMAQGKDGKLYLLDRTNLGGIATQSKPANVGMLPVLNGEISSAGAWATLGGTTTIVVRPNGNGSGIGCPNGTSGSLVAVKLDASAPSKMSVVWCADAQGGGSPIITSSDGKTGGLVWAAGAESSNRLHAWDLATGAVVVDGTKTSLPLKNNETLRHFTTVLAANGRIVVGADDGLYAFGP